MGDRRRGTSKEFFQRPPPGDTCREHYEFRGGIFVADGVEKTRELETEQEEKARPLSQKAPWTRRPKRSGGPRRPSEWDPASPVQTGRHHGQNPRDSSGSAIVAANGVMVIR